MRLSAALALAALALLPASAGATMPGFNGRLVTQLDALGALKSVNIDGSGERLYPDDEETQIPKWSPDGRQIALERFHPGGPGKVTDVYVMNADGSGLHQLTSGGANGDPTWSPDGTRIAYSHNGLQAEGIELKVINVDGSNDRFILRRTNNTLAELAWSPDGTRIAFMQHDLSVSPRKTDIYTIHPDGTALTRLTSNPDNERAPSWSPDGSRIAFHSDRDAARKCSFDFTPENDDCDLDIYSMRSDGTDVRRLTSSPSLERWPTWSPDGRKIAFTSSRYGQSVGSTLLWIMDANGSHQVFTGISGAFQDWQPLPTPGPAFAPVPSRVEVGPERVVSGETSRKGLVDLTDVAPIDGTVVHLTSSAPGAAAVPSTVTVRSGNARASFPVTITPVTVDTPVTITARVGTRSVTDTITVYPPARLTDLFVPTIPIVGGPDFLGQGQIDLSGPAPYAGAAVHLTSSSSSVVVPSTVNVPRRVEGAFFSLRTGRVCRDTPVTISASYGGRTIRKTMTLTRQPGDLTGMTLDHATTVGGSFPNVVATVTATGIPSFEPGKTVSLSSSDPSVVFVQRSVTMFSDGQAQFDLHSQRVTTTKTVTITATYGCGRKTATITVTP